MTTTLAKDSAARSRGSAQSVSLSDLPAGGQRDFGFCDGGRSTVVSGSAKSRFFRLGELFLNARFQSIRHRTIGVSVVVTLQ